MYYSFASPFAALGNAGATRSPARPTEGASTFPLDLSSKTPPLAVPPLSALSCPMTAARDLLDHQRALAASMLGSAFPEWAPGLATSAAELKAASTFDSKTGTPLGLNQQAPTSSTPSGSGSSATGSVFLEQQKQLAALMFSCHALVDPVAMFRARSLQAALAGAAGVSGVTATAPPSTQSALGGTSIPFVPPVYPLGDLWTARNFEPTLPRSDEGTAIKPHVSQPSPQKLSQVQAQALAAAKAPLKTEKTFQPWKDDVGCPTPTKPSKPKKTPFNIEALSKPDDSTTAVTGAGECSAPKDDETKDFKFSLHPKKRRLASPDIPEEACQAINSIASSIPGIASIKPKKRAVQVLQKWDEPTASSSTTSTSLPLQQDSPSQPPTPVAAGPLTVVPEQLEESLLHRAARTGNLEMVNFCLERCGEVDVNQRGRSQATALHEAASKGFVSGARALLERGADPETETPQGVRPLHEAAAKGHIEVIRLLLSYGAQVDAKTLSGDTAVSIASMFDFQLLRTFLEDFIEDNTFVDEEAAEKGQSQDRKPWTFKGTSSCLDRKLESGFDVLAGAPECCLLPEIAIRTFRVLRPIGENGAMQSLTCAHLDELIASTGLTDVGVFLRTIGEEISHQIVFSVDRTMETDAFSKYYDNLATVRAIRWDEESKRLLSQALSRGQDQQQQQQQQLTGSNVNTST